MSLAVVFVIAWFAFPFPMEKLASSPTCRVVFDSSGMPLRVTLAEGDTLCVPVRLEQVSDWAVKATIAAEDKRFYDHCGVDPLAGLRALGQNLCSLRTVSGASTITMQVVRLIEPRPRTFVSKAYESFRALQLEAECSKERILEEYLNRAPYGSNIIGIEAASLRYFGISARQLSLGQSALLAGLPQSPARLRPDRHATRARARRRYVLERMIACGFIDAVGVARANAEPIPAAMRDLPFAAPHFAEHLLARYPAETELFSTLDPRIQEAAEDCVREAVAGLRHRGVSTGAAVVIENRSGSVRAMVGAADYFAVADHGQVNAATSCRSPGSALKPFTYALAFENRLCVPETVLFDVPSAYPAYSPTNYDEQYRGPVTAREALAESLNIPAIRLLEQVGVANLHAFLRDCGISTLTRGPDHYGLALTMGGVDVTLLDLCVAYRVLASGGLFAPARLLETEPAGEGVRVVSPGAAWLVTDILLRNGAAAELGDSLACGARPVPRFAWKTGTSASHRDAVCVGYNPDYTVGVWLGNASGAPTSGVTGSEGAAPVVHALFREMSRASAGRSATPDADTVGPGAGDIALLPAPEFAPPPDVENKTVCRTSGRPAGTHCGATTETLCLSGTGEVGLPAQDAPWAEPCNIHRLVMVDKISHCVLCSACRGTREYEWRKCCAYDPETATFLRSRGAGGGEAMPPHNPACAACRGGARPRIAFPHDGQRFKLLSNVDHLRQQLSLSAAVGSDVSRLCWFVDGALVGSSAGVADVVWPLMIGTHEIVCVDDRGGSDSVRIVVE
ncbi:MAG: penicillin-binding protein 1C [Planctomycetota bacterium]|nr:penicillin-binding protein 1C [Planctomycetota bacterium]